MTPIGGIPAGIPVALVAGMQTPHNVTPDYPHVRAEQATHRPHQELLGAILAGLIVVIVVLWVVLLYIGLRGILEIQEFRPVSAALSEDPAVASSSQLATWCAGHVTVA